MPVVIARWSNGTFSVLRMPVGFSMSSLYWELDTEANPLDAQLYLLKTDDDGWSHMTFDWGARSPQVGELSAAAGELDTHAGKLRNLKWPRGIVRQAYRVAFAEDKRRSANAMKLSSDELEDFPAEPSETFSVVEVRAMEPFCGVYFAYNADGSCHYVGESENVPCRVTKSRTEISERRIGIIKCAPHERKLIEAFFVAVLDPPGNAISTHRMKSKKEKAAL